MLAFMATCGLSVNAANKVVGERFTTIGDLDGKLFAVVDESSSTAMGFGIPDHGNGWDMYFGTYNQAYESNACYLKMEAASDGEYYLHTYNSAGNLYDISWASGGYFNSQLANKDVCFALGKDQDGVNLSVWSIEVSEGKFALKNKGTGLFLHNDSKPAKYEDPFYFTFCTLIDDPLPAAQEKYTALKAKYLEINGTLDVTDAETLYASATTVNDIQAAIDKLVSIFGSSLADNTNLTGLITNPSFESGITGWTNNGMAVQNNNSYSGKVGTNYCEAWQPNGTKGVSQTLTLPNGLYRMSANSLARTVTSAKLYAGSKEEAITIADASDTYTFEFFVNGGGDVAIGFEGVGTGAGDSWLCVDNFQLAFVQDMTAEGYDYYLAMNAAKALEGKIPAAAYEYVQKAIDENTVTDGTAEQYSAAATVLNAAVAAVESLVEPYATWLELKAQAQALAAEGHATINAAITKVGNAVETIVTADDLNAANTYTASLMTHYVAWDELYNSANVLKDVSNNNETANTTLKSSITTQFAAIAAKFAQLNSAANPTPDMIDQLDNAVESATTALKAAMTTYVTTAEPINDECFDLTFLIVNPHFKEGQGGKAIPTGWTLESGSITEHRLATHNFEAYHMTFNLSQTIPNLQKGTYKVTLQGFARHDNANVTDKTNLYCGIVNQPIKSIKDEYSTKPLASGQPDLGDYNGEASYPLNGTTVYQPNGMSGSYYFFKETNPATELPFYTNEVKTLITKDGELKIGFKCETTSDWVIWDNFHLYYYGSAIAVTLDEATGTSYTEDIENANVTLKKTIYEGWNTITIPFAATAEAFGADALYKYTRDTEDGILNFETAETIEPNVPYLLSAPENGFGEYPFNGVTVKAANAETMTTLGTNYDFVGIYQEATVAEGDYILGDGAFYRSAGGNKVKAYRAYIKAKSDTPNNARLKISINGVVTAIDTIDGQAVNNAAIYNLAGQKVERAQKGIYIQNGKKVVVK